MELSRLQQWLDEAKMLPLAYPNAMALTTATTDGRPSTRIVLLKAIDERGIVFYTNYNSRKGREMQNNPSIVATFFWPDLCRELTVTGKVEPVSSLEADTYFHSRPFLSRAGAWASAQSRIMYHPAIFYIRLCVVLLKALAHGGKIPRPPYWSGFRIIPDNIEFLTRDNLEHVIR